MEAKNNSVIKNLGKNKGLLIIIFIMGIALIVLAAINLKENKNKSGENKGTINASSGQENSLPPNAPDDDLMGERSLSEPGLNGTVSAAGQPDSGAAGSNSQKTVQKPEAPIEKTNPITVKMEISSKGFNPGSFEVKAGQEVTLSVSSIDNVAILVFDSPELSGLSAGIGTGQTKEIKFTAPVKRGEYSFHNDIPGKNQPGKIIVK